MRFLPNAPFEGRFFVYAALLTLTVSCQHPSRRVETGAPVSVSRVQSVTKLNDAPVGASEEAIRQSFSFAADHVGLALIDLDTGQVVERIGETIPRVPASTFKLPTALWALEVLGPHFKAQTTLAYRGIFHSDTGLLDGQIFLKGGGDPTLDASALMDMVQSLRWLGVKKVVGEFIYDESLFPKTLVLEKGQPDDAAYNAGISALQSEFGRMEIEWRESPSHHMEWWSKPGWAIDQMSMSSRPLPEGAFFGLENGQWVMGPSIPNDETKTDLPQLDPGLYTARLFQELASSIGISLPSPASGRMPEKAKILHVHEGRALIDVVDGLLEFSNNQVAELIELHAAMRVKGASLASIQEASSIQQRWWEKRLPKIDWSGWSRVNGSGLSVSNRVTPIQMASIAQSAWNKTYGGEHILRLLPISGHKGTLEKRLTHPDASFRVWAKTGTMDFVVGLTGYLFPRSGKPHAFAIYVNDLPKRDAASLEAREEWERRARHYVDEVLRYWIRNR